MEIVEKLPDEINNLIFKFLGPNPVAKMVNERVMTYIRIKLFRRGKTLNHPFPSFWLEEAQERFYEEVFEYKHIRLRNRITQAYDYLALLPNVKIRRTEFIKLPRWIKKAILDSEGIRRNSNKLFKDSKINECFLLEQTKLLN